MQISIEEVLSMLLSRVEGLAMQSESHKTRINVLARALYRKGLLTKEELLESLVAEHQLMVELGALPQMPSDEDMAAMNDSFIQWLEGDAEAIKKSMEEYQAKLQEMMRAEAAKPRLDVASAEDLRRLDQMKDAAGGKLILP